MNLSGIEDELQKRLRFPYQWGQRQNDALDATTNFIYKISGFDELVSYVHKEFGEKPNHRQVFNYSLNRWYNFWSAKAIESIFCFSTRVKPAIDERDRLVDFQIDGIDFDHKTSVFPRRYPDSLEFAMNNPRNLIEWLYENQSQQQRKHLRNRLFIVLHSKDGNHWRLKAEISWLRQIIDKYLQNFDPKQLHRLEFKPQSVTLSDIIWGTR